MGDGPNKVGMAAVLAVVAVSAGVGAGLMSRAQTPALPTISSPPISPVADLEVHVAGWVVSPGVVTVTDGAIVADAIAAAGGMRSGADAASLNLAAAIRRGDQIVVPGPGDGQVAGRGDSDQLISLSRATSSELEELPGVGPVLAERIVAFREDHGPFQAVEDLLEVPGIGEAKLASLRDLVRP